MLSSVLFGNPLVSTNSEGRATEPGDATVPTLLSDKTDRASYPPHRAVRDPSEAEQQPYEERNPPSHALVPVGVIEIIEQHPEQP